MANASDYLENQLIDHIFRTASFTKPTQLNIALYTVSPSDSGGGTEVSGGSYVRKALNPLDANWDATQGGNSGSSTGNSGATANSSEILFAAPTADWGQVVAFAIFDQSSNMLMWGPITPNKTINNSDPAPKFIIGDMDISIA